MSLILNQASRKRAFQWIQILFSVSFREYDFKNPNYIIPHYIFVEFVMLIWIETMLIRPADAGYASGLTDLKREGRTDGL